MRIQKWIYGLILALAANLSNAALITTPANGAVTLTPPDALGKLTATIDFGFTLSPSDIQQTVGGPGGIHLGEFLFDARVDFGLDTLGFNEAFRIESPTGGSRTTYNEAASFLEYTAVISSGEWLQLTDGIIEFDFIPLIQSPSGVFSVGGNLYAQSPVVDVASFSISVINNPNYSSGSGGSGSNSVPEPGALPLVVFGLFGLLSVLKTRKRKNT